jgi:hypothetical protein
MPSFRMQFPCRDVGPLADRFGVLEDDACLAAGRAARERGHYTREEFVRVCAWKTARSRSRVATNSGKDIKRASQRALGSEVEATRMEALLALTGVGVPTASTLLYFAFPDAYPILDVRALDSLGVKARSQYPVSFWLAYLSACRELAARCGVDIRTLDKALWQYSKERATPHARAAARRS